MRRARVAAPLLAWLLASAAALADETPEQAALRTLDAFMAAFNARDAEAMTATLHFPHVRIASRKVAVFPDPAAFRASMEFARFAQATGWDHSRWDERRVVQSSPDKVHVAVKFTRFRADGSVIASYDSLYVITKQGSHWGVQARSSFAP